ncbi:flagellar biosynthesis anti-sigma factor FlgM [Variovorax sp. GT1P44]|uniref:flagellar biosynthesis anti-sigma factor FlgM n=1 Tax=Variovorax sp. GT1P44 TaxID=3443742 RepID=UPI003F47A2FB
MKIDQPAPSATPLPRTPKAGTAAPASGTEAAERAKEAATVSGQVHALPAAPGGGDFDAARVAAIREDIRAGRYQVNPERIASGLLDSVRNLLDAKKNP